MKQLKIENGCGYFKLESGDYTPIDKISKDDLLRFVNAALSGGDFEFDAYDEIIIQNHAHQIIYKSVVRKLQSLLERRQEFVDESSRLYLEDYEKYKSIPTS